MKLPSLNTQILVGAILGIAVGIYFHAVGQDSEPAKAGLYISGLVGGVFIDMLKMVLVPLVFSSITVGIANLQQHRQAQKVWKVTLAFFMFSMTVAIIVGLSAANIFKPGEGLHLGLFAEAMQNFEAKQMSLGEFFAHFLHGLFVNPVNAMAQGNVLPIVVFALFVGVAIVVGGERYRNILNLLQELFELTMRIVSWIMRLSPFGIMALLIKLVATQDVALLGSVGKFIAVIIGTTLLHGVVVLPLILYLFTKVTPWAFWKGSRDALITAFATSSSSATMPVTLRCVQEELHVPREIASFVIPFGATVNMDGTALYEAAAALFIANLAGVELNLVQQMIVFFTAMIAAMGAPGIPSAGMVTMVMVLQSVGLPAEAIAILLPIDRLLDTVRTAVNVEGDMIGSIVTHKLVGDSGKI